MSFILQRLCIFLVGVVALGCRGCEKDCISPDETHPLRGDNQDPHSEHLSLQDLSDYGSGKISSGSEKYKAIAKLVQGTHSYPENDEVHSQATTVDRHVRYTIDD